MSIAVAKERVQNIRAHAQQVIDQFDRLLQRLGKQTAGAGLYQEGWQRVLLRSKPVEAAIRNRRRPLLNSANETWVETIAACAGRGRESEVSVT